MRLVSFLAVLFLLSVPSNATACEVGRLFVEDLHKYYDDWKAAPKELQPTVLEYIADSDYIKKLDELECIYNDLNLKKNSRFDRLNSEISSKIFEKWEMQAWDIDRD